MTASDPEYAHEYLEALRLFNRGLYFESHEELEGLWVRLPKCPDKTFYQAIIHIAAAFLHRSRERAKPALAQYRRACDKFSSLGQNEYQGMDLAELMEMLDPYFLPLEENPTVNLEVPAPILALKDYSL